MAGLVLALGLVPLLEAGQAEAKCINSTESAESFVVGGQVVAKETPNPGTCDSDTWYSFYLFDGPTQDGYCTYIHFYETAGTSLLNRYTCSGVSTYYDDSNTVFLHRFKRSSGGTWSGYEYGYGH